MQRLQAISSMENEQWHAPIACAVPLLNVVCVLNSHLSTCYSS
jgi:hypothetical protein